MTLSYLDELRAGIVEPIDYDALEPDPDEYHDTYRLELLP